MNKEVEPTIQKENLLFQLQRLGEEGKNTRRLQEIVWEEIKEEIDEKVSREQDEKRNPNR